ncbi:MAG: DUF3224 domain-containing protein [Gemmatimonadaceae bacterium]
MIDKKDAAPVEWAGGHMGHNSFYKTFTGDITGTSLVKAIMLMTDSPGPAVYVGIERYDCTVRGKKGTFLLTHSAVMLNGAQAAQWTIVEGSGTDELKGIRGRGEILPKHDFVLEYEFT